VATATKNILLFLSTLVLLSCGAPKLDPLQVNKDYTVIPEIAKFYLVPDGAFENKGYSVPIKFNEVQDGRFGIELSGQIFVPGDGNKVFLWFLKQSVTQGWGDFAGDNYFKSFDPDKGEGYMSIYKERRTLSLEFLQKPGWEYVRINYLGMAYRKVGDYLDNSKGK